MEWISIEKSLPALKDRGDGYWSSDVVVVASHGGIFVASLDKRGVWQEQNTGCDCCSIPLNPTYWMPLPTPPKE